MGRFGDVIRKLRPALLIVGILGSIIAIAFATSPDSNDGSRSPLLNDETSPVVALIPDEGDEILRQDRVGVELKPGFFAELSINGVPIPNDELNQTPSLGLYFYLARSGNVIEELNGDRNCATATVRPFSRPADVADRISWCFTVA